MIDYISHFIQLFNRYEPARGVAWSLAALSLVAAGIGYAGTGVDTWLWGGGAAALIAVIEGELIRTQVFPHEKIRDGAPLFYDENRRAEAYDEELYR